MPEELFKSVGPKRSAKVARVREALPQIEAAFAQGHGHAAIHERLCDELGIDITFKYYELAVHRLRKAKADADTLQAQDSQLRNPSIGTSRPAVASARGSQAQVAGDKMREGAGVQGGPAGDDSKFKWDPMAPVRW